MSIKPVRYGVIGLGWFGEKHCEAISSIHGAELAAVCTRTKSRLDEIRARFSVPQAYQDYRELLANPEIDVIDVVTMWDQHAEPTLAALQAGKHVFLEKPMASTVEDARAIAAAAERSAGYLMVGHICRFNPRYAAAKRELDEGRVGKVVSIYSRRNIPAWVTTDILNKIGPIMGDAIHDTDLMLWFTGAKIKTAYAQTLSLRGKKYPDLGWTMYRFESGAIGTLETVWCLPDKTPFAIDERMEIIGTEGAIHIQDQYPDFAMYDREGWRSPDVTYWPLLHDTRAGALRDELTYFTTCITRGERPTVITPRESLAAVEGCLAAERSSQSGQVERVS